MSSFSERRKSAARQKKYRDKHKDDEAYKAKHRAQQAAYAQRQRVDKSLLQDALAATDATVKRTRRQINEMAMNMQLASLEQDENRESEPEDDDIETSESSSESEEAPQPSWSPDEATAKYQQAMQSSGIIEALTGLTKNEYDSVVLLLQPVVDNTRSDGNERKRRRFNATRLSTNVQIFIGLHWLHAVSRAAQRVARRYEMLQILKNLFGAFSIRPTRLWHFISVCRKNT